jgi:hypothetical protein
LKERIALEKSTIHWKPYKKILVTENPSGEEEEICWDEPPRAIEEFPTDFLTRDNNFTKI